MSPPTSRHNTPFRQWGNDIVRNFVVLGLACSILTPGTLHAVEKNPFSSLPSLQVIPASNHDARSESALLESMLREWAPDNLDAPSGKLGLNAILALVRDGHPAIIGKNAEIDATDAGKIGAMLRFLPAPSLDTTNRDGKTATTLRLEQPLWTGGKLMAGLDSANTRARISNANLSETELTLSLRATSLYQNYLSIVNRIAVLDNGIRKMQALVDMITRRASAGTSAKADIDLAASRIAQLRTERISAENALQTILSQLSQITGLRIPRNALITQVGQPPEINMEELELRVMSSHPTLLRAQLDIDLAATEKTMAKAVLWPTVSVRAEHQEGEYQGSMLPGNRVYVALTYTPGAGLASLADISAASAKIRSAESELENKRRDLLDRLRSEYSDYESARYRLPELSRVSLLTSDILDSSARLFVLGRRSWLDLLNSVREMVSAQQQEADIRAQAFGAYQRLRLWAGEPVWTQE